MEENKDLVSMEQRNDNGVIMVSLTLEPNKIDQLGKECRLGFEDFCDAINEFIEEEENDWSDLRMKDQIDMTRDIILTHTILKYAKETYDLKAANYNGRDVSYIRRYDIEGRFIGEAVVVSLTSIPMMNMSMS